MEVNSNVKKVIATMALIADTQDQINRVKAELDASLRTARLEYDTRLRDLRNSLQEHHDMLGSICGPEYDQPRNRSSRGSYQEATSDAQILRARATRYIGEQVLNPTPELTDAEREII